MNEKELIKQLQDLPKTVEAKDQWAQIKQAINSQTMNSQSMDSKIQAKETVVKNSAKRKWLYPVSIAASVFVVAFLAMQLPQNTTETELNYAQVKVLNSLQQANNQYYSALGNVMEARATALPNGLKITLKDLREAQASYRLELTDDPNNTAIYRKLIRTYQTERELLKNLVS
ncbi:hypothetical protein [Kangiella sp. HZ709]|uniref:hypothetical protein n=1 Tax=Kangiella sp. HZ709 TaxID=2666328 RepID=UPI0012AEF9BB|nr:hypothetical protein [Kangiella sp. HZ709]MRX27510.1 hypothetical protein [Kangiella sp. HZ709]